MSFVQGIGGALSSAVVLGMIVTMFPEPREQAKAIGVYGFVASAGGSIGLLAGGVLTEAISGHWIFFINVPIGIATALLAKRLVDDHEGIGIGEGADLRGAAVLTAGLMLGVYAILQVSERGWGSLEVLGLGAVSVAMVAGFVACQARIPNPLMPPRLFRARNVAGANIVMALLVAGMFAIFFLATVQVGGAIGLAVLATLAAARADALEAVGASADAALNSGFHLAYLIGAGLVALGALAAAVLLRSDAPASTHQEPGRETVGRGLEPALSESG